MTMVDQAGEQRRGSVGELRRRRDDASGSARSGNEIRAACPGWPFSSWLCGSDVLHAKAMAGTVAMRIVADRQGEW